MIRSFGLEGLLERHGLVVAVNVGEAHLLQSLLAIQLVVTSVSLLAHILHVCTDQHFTQFHEIAMSLVFDLNDALR